MFKISFKKVLVLFILTITIGFILYLNYEPNVTPLASGGEQPQLVDDGLDQKINYKVDKKNYFDTDGNLLVPYDIAYEEHFKSGEVLYEEDTILIKFLSVFDGRVSRNLDSAGIEELSFKMAIDQSHWYEAKLKEGLNVIEVMATVRSLDEVIVADYNYIYETEEVIEFPELLGNPSYDSQWQLKSYGIPEAWQWMNENGYQAGGSSSVVVAVIDTGVDYNHKDLAANMWVNIDEIPGNNIDDDNNGYIDDVHGVNVVSDIYYHTGDPMDDHGHGTHVAGIIAAANNKEGIVGVAYNAKIMAIKAGQASGYFTQADIAEAILYAYDNGADVINMSFGGTGMSIAVQDALKTAYTRSVLIASAGNSGAANEGLFAIPNYPAAYSYVVGVMSVNSLGTESVFTNYDLRSYNAIEYEVYAPGEGILSTIPNDGYATWSGTSMSAPIVSGIAALIRSVYTDRDMYPNKFIMGQLTATSETSAACLDPTIHRMHNLPMIINAYQALTNMPKPDVSLYDYFVFDNQAISIENNGDGIIDAGETIDLGLILRNRWGMSQNTIISIDSISPGGIPNPYVTFLTNDINYEGVGTYSTKDYLLRNEEFVIGVENPFRIQIDANTPNDYVIVINVNGSMSNALDPLDIAIYTFTSKIELVVRNGVILPNVIDQDLTLTKDNYYIIPNATLIKEGVTVTVEPGTKIQFWTDDSNDLYADTAITYLKVEGKFISQGTTDEPVEIFPSELMSDYRVEIFESNNGYVSLFNTEITNPYINISNADRVLFKQNYLNYLRYRYLYEGNVQVASSEVKIDVDTINNSIFYALGGGYVQLYSIKVSNSIFVNSAIHFSSNVYYENNVFLKNNNLDYYNSKSSSITLNTDYNLDFIKSVYNNITGHTYILIKFPYEIYNNHYSYLETLNKFASINGGSLLIIESLEEQEFLQSNLSSSISEWPNAVYTGLNNIDNGILKWNNDEPVGDFILGNPEHSGYIALNSDFSTAFSYGYGKYAVIELPNAIYINGINLSEFSTDIDLDSKYQINATLTPSTAAKESLIYVSDDEGVATVSETGLVTPVSYGSAKIYIYSNDYNKQAVFEVSVIEKIIIESIDATMSNYQIEAGKVSSIFIDYYPNNTTQKEVIYTSSNELVATINNFGEVSAVNVGTTTIRVASVIDSTIYDEFIINVVKPVTSIAFTESTYVTDLLSTIDNIQPVVLPLDATNRGLIWESSNPEVAYVNELGELIKLTNGITTLRATVENTDLSAELILSVNDNYVPGEVTKIINRSGYYIALYSDGNLYYWGKEVLSPKLISLNVNVVDFAFDHEYLYILDNAGILSSYYSYKYSAQFNVNPLVSNIYNINGIVKIENNYGQDSLYLLKNDGSVWAKGSNNYGQLGDGTTTDRTEFVQVLVNDIVDVQTGYNLVAFLNLSGEMYMAGGYYPKMSTPTKILDGVISISSINNNYSINARTANETRYYNPYEANFFINYRSFYTNNEYFVFTDQNQIYIENQLVFVQGQNIYGLLGVGDFNQVYSFENMLKIENAKKIFSFEGNLFIQTYDNKFYGTGVNTSNELGNFTKENSAIPVQIFFGLVGNDSGFVVENNNINDGFLYEDKVILDFTESMLTSVNYSYITIKDSSDQSLAIFKNLNLDKFEISLFNNWVIGETYYLTIPANSLTTKFMVANEAITYTFTYMGEQTPINFVSSSILNNHAFTENEVSISIDYTYAREGTLFNEIGIVDSLGNPIVGPTVTLNNNTITINGVLDFGNYKVVVPAGALIDNMGGTNSLLEINFSVEQTLKLIDATHIDGDTRKLVDQDIIFTFNQAVPSTNFSSIALYDSLDQIIPSSISLVDNVLTINPDSNLLENTEYYIYIPMDAVVDNLGNYNQDIVHRFTTYTPLMLERTSIADLAIDVNPNQTIRFFYNYAEAGLEFGNIKVYDLNNIEVVANVVLLDGVLYVTPQGLDNQAYKIVIPANALVDELSVGNSYTEINYSTVNKTERFFYTTEYMTGKINDYIGDGLFSKFTNNAILNNLNETNMDTWLRFTAYETEYNVAYFESIGMGRNYWGTTNLEMINKQILDFDDYQSLYDINVGLYLETAPETAFPFVTKVTIVNSSGEITRVVGNETIQVIVEFNRDMDMTVPLDVRFGSSLPYAEYKIEGAYETSRKWVGLYTLVTTIENGNQYFSIDNGHVVGDSWFSLQPDTARFMFEIDTTSAQAMIMQGTATETGISLTWEQDDFSTLAGYNVYRSTSEDGYYQRLNDFVIPSDTKTFFDEDVQPGVIYYYNFTVVKTDLTESLPSGKIVIMSLDTMAPNIYHTPIYQAYTGNNLVITATVTDNLMIQSATVYYRMVGETSWRSAIMTNNNDRYSAVISADYLTLDGFEYYIEAFDGVSYTYKGSSTSPYNVIVKEAVDINALGDVNADGTITVLDALMVLQAINDRLNLDADQFVRADLDGDGILEAWEALRILQYVSGKVTTIV